METNDISKNMTSGKAVVVIKENPVADDMLKGLCDSDLVAGLMVHKNLDEGVSCLIEAGCTEFEIGFAVASAILISTLPTTGVTGCNMCSNTEDESDAAISN